MTLQSVCANRTAPKCSILGNNWLQQIRSVHFCAVDTRVLASNISVLTPRQLLSASCGFLARWVHETNPMDLGKARLAPTAKEQIPEPTSCSHTIAKCW